MSDLLSIIPDDGYTESAYVDKQRGIHGAHRIRYRPLTHSERYVVGNALSTKPPVEASQILYATLASKIKEWDVCAASGATLPITSANVAILKPNLTERLYSIVSGHDGGDQDPDAKPEGDKMDAALQAILEGKTAGEVQEEAAVKN